MLKFVLFNTFFWSWFVVLICHLSTFVVKPNIFHLNMGGMFNINIPYPALKEAFNVLLKKAWKPSTNTVNQIIMLIAVYCIVLLFLLIIVSFIPKLFANKKTKIYGSAKWATKRDLKKAALLGPYGVIMGQTGEAKYKQIPFKKKKSRKMTDAEKEIALAKNPDERLKYKYKLKKQGDIISHHETQHVLGIGGTRSGKGIGLVIPTRFSWNGSLICMDPKGEAWQITAPFRSTFSRTMKLEPENPRTSAHYNPLAAIRRGTSALSDIQSLAAIFIP